MENPYLDKNFLSEISTSIYEAPKFDSAGFTNLLDCLIRDRICFQLGSKFFKTDTIVAIFVESIHVCLRKKQLQKIN